MADLLSKEMLADLIINIINILILFFVAKALLYKPVKKYLDARKQAQADAMQAAEKEQAEARKKKEKYDALMADSAALRTNTMREAKQQADAEAQKILDDAQQKADAYLQANRLAAEQEKAKMLAEAKEQLGVLAVEISEKIIGREVTDADNRAIIDSFFGA